MDNDLKIKLDAIESKLDMSIEHRETLCKLLHKPINEHLEEAPKFRDKVVANGIWVIACWTVIIIMLGRVLWSALAGIVKG